MNAEIQPKKLPKPTSYDQLYPGRFIKAAELLGKKVTLTMTDVELEELEGDDGKKVKCIVSFKETPKKLVACKTNGLCVKEMFGKDLANWMGKRITLYEDQWNGEPAIRIWGSPDLAEELEVTVALPRRRPFKKVMHKVGAQASVKSETHEDGERITTDQAVFLADSLKEAKIEPRLFLAKFGISALENLPRLAYERAVAYILEKGA